ncbi:aldo/keto reductase [Nonomuraea sp. K274]|uniref:Aldo/keto reductase n=1 Tax=Nonomuraea cypriaca TaxID=1187855 RepID=A0A931A7H1_9ACTN|nr:aldo/keto reductase [Nonomuraea cypriaca]MBF8187681.1 aldo/keto reductase [Nonomuraea cypriaca]
MDYIPLGATNLRTSRIAFGAMGIGSPIWRSWVLDEGASVPIIERAVELGITFFDTSNFYSKGESERVLGATLKRLLPREDYILATKVGNPMGTTPTTGGYSRKHILAAVDDSLRRLDVDYIDLYQTHVWREGTNIEETLSALDALVESGKVRYVGATDMPVWQFAKFLYEARRLGRHGFATMQHHYNLVWREHESELIPMCQAEGIGLLPYSPLARGFLSGDPRGHDRDTERGRTDEYSRKWYGRASDQRVLESLRTVAAERGADPAAVSVAWVLAKSPTGAPILGPTSADQLDVVEQALSMDLTPEEIAVLESPYVARLRYGH